MPPADGFLETLRSLCDAHGALLIFDETATGMRVASGGASMLYGVSPDLTLLGPIIGGGLPLAACGGRKEIMNRPDDRIPGNLVSTAHSPLSGNMLAVAAGVATLQAVGESGFYEALEARSARLDEGFRASAASAGVPMQHARVGSILGTGLVQRPAVQLQQDLSADASRVDEGETALFARYFQGMLDRGILLPPSPCASLFVSAAHTDEDIDRTVQASHEALQAAVR
jgi:glutamate-1-semialdehyde 2,1-aminomutase